MERVTKLSTEQLLRFEEGKIYCFSGVSFAEVDNMRALAYYVSKRYGKGEWKITHRQRNMGDDTFSVELERVAL